MALMRALSIRIANSCMSKCKYFICTTFECSEWLITKLSSVNGFGAKWECKKFNERQWTAKINAEVQRLTKNFLTREKLFIQATSLLGFFNSNLSLSPNSYHYQQVKISAVAQPKEHTEMWKMVTKKRQHFSKTAFFKTSNKKSQNVYLIVNL